MRSVRIKNNKLARIIERELISSLEQVAACGERAKKLIVAVSGGVDSTVLLHSLAELKKKCELELVVAHVNHALRETSDRDQSFVQQMAGRLGLSCRSCSLDPQSRRHGENVEAWARRSRYAVLEQWRQEEGAQLLCTAHHKDDLAETILMRLLSGRMLSSAFSLTQYTSSTHILRPFLQLRRQELLRYAQLAELSWVHDETNDDRGHLRNRLRHELLPLLRERYNPVVEDALAALAQRLNSDEAELGQITVHLFRLCAEPFSLEYLRSLPDALRWRFLLLLAREAAPSAEVATLLGYKAIKRLERAVLVGNGQVELGSGFNALVGSSKLLFKLSSEKSLLKAGRAESETLSIPGNVTRQYEGWGEAKITARVVCCKELELGDYLETLRTQRGDPYREASAAFDLAQLSAMPLFVRERQDGDWIDAWKRGKRKLKKIFQEQRVQLTLRDALPIVSYGREILWVPGVSRSKLAPISEDSEKLLLLEYIRS